ncbi:hypothetical protein E4U41_003911, partial [Claviceps citrina]
MRQLGKNSHETLGPTDLEHSTEDENTNKTHVSGHGAVAIKLRGFSRVQAGSFHCVTEDD